MTDTTTLDETPDCRGARPSSSTSERLGADGTAEDTPLKDRAVLLPFLVPLLSIAIVAVLRAQHLARVPRRRRGRRAGRSGIIITLAILVGASLIAAAPRLRTSSLAMILGGRARAWCPAPGWCRSGRASTTARAVPRGYVAAHGRGQWARVDVEALASIKFNATEYTAPVGIVADQLQRRHRPHPGDSGPEVRRLPAHHRRRRAEDGQGRAGGRQVHDLLHRPRPRGAGDEGHPHRVEVSLRFRRGVAVVAFALLAAVLFVACGGGGGGDSGPKAYVEPKGAADRDHRRSRRATSTSSPTTITATPGIATIELDREERHPRPRVRRRVPRVPARGRRRRRHGSRRRST